MEKRKEEIRLPEGCFMGNCYDCRNADWNERKNGMVYCRASDWSLRGWQNPDSRNGCTMYR